MVVEPGSAAATENYQGTAWYFCSERCHASFRADPVRFAPATAAPTTKTRKSAVYTCPMHPEVVQDHPGNCPTCGMALEPRSAAREEENPELKDMIRRFWVSAVLAAPAV